MMTMMTMMMTSDVLAGAGGVLECVKYRAFWTLDGAVRKAIRSRGRISCVRGTCRVGEGVVTATAAGLFYPLFLTPRTVGELELKWVSSLMGAAVDGCMALVSTPESLPTYPGYCLSCLCYRDLIRPLPRLLYFSRT